MEEVLDDLIEESVALPTEDSYETIEDHDLEEVETEPSLSLSEGEESILQLAIEAQDAETEVIAQENIIPVNSPSLLIDETTSRFSSAIWYDAIRTKTITLAGVGGIGSYVAFLLARLHPDDIILYDDDNVEAANMSGQLYSLSQVNLSKVEAIYQTMKNFADYRKAFTKYEKFTRHSTASNIMICGFDNMAARETFFNKWYTSTMNDVEENKGRHLLIDGRLAAEEFQVFAIKGDDLRAIQEYRDNWLFKDSDAEETLCSYKQTTFMANMIGSIIVNLFVNFVANECDPIFPRDVPFLTTYDASRMYFKVEM